jgi:predicted DNA-binding transcriptional regulator AlpA
MTNNKQSGDLLINIDEASKITNYSLSSLYSKTSKNQIPYTKKTGSKRLWFNKEELLKWRKKPSQNKKNKVKNEMRDSEKLTNAQKVIIMLGMLEQWKTSPILKPFRTTNLDYGTTRPMSEKEAIITLAYYNDWRRGDGIPPPKPSEITEAIRVVIQKFKERTFDEHRESRNFDDDNKEIFKGD